MKPNQHWLHMHLLLCTVCGIYGRQENLLFFTFTNLKEIDLTTGVVTTLANTTAASYSIAYDVKGRYVYASIFDENSIVRFPYPNNQSINFEIVVSAINPYDKAFDSENSHLYWTEYASFGRIMRCNSDGSGLTIIVNDTFPFALTLDTYNRWIYYSKSSSNAIYRMTFDGKEKQEVLPLTSQPVDIEIDFVDKRIYWMDYDVGDLKSAFYNGSGVDRVSSAYSTIDNREIEIIGKCVFYTSITEILKKHKSTGDIPAKVHTETTTICGVLFYKQGDFADKRVYWMEYDTGDLKSALYNGSDVKTMVSTNVIGGNREIDIGGDYVFYTSTKNILKIHKSSGQIPAVVHQEPLPIYGLLFYKQEMPMEIKEMRDAFLTFFLVSINSQIADKEET